MFPNHEMSVSGPYYRQIVIGFSYRFTSSLPENHFWTDVAISIVNRDTVNFEISEPWTEQQNWFG